MICGDVHDLPFDENFSKIEPIFPLREMPPEVVDDLSTDQRYSYRITKMIHTGEVDEDLLELKTGEVDHSRWVTTGNRIERAWVSKHGLKGKALEGFRVIVEFVSNFYFPMWFEIKADSSIVQGPYHILREIQILQKMKGEDERSMEVKEIAMKFVEKGAWHAHSEHLLVSLLSSSDESDRRFAIDKIVSLRDGNEFGDRSVRPFSAPKLNWNAQSIRDIQDWADTTEPLVTTSIPTPELAKFIENPLKIPKYPSHTQSCERAVKEVSRASKNVFGAERRDGFIRATMKCREVLPVMEKKTDFEALIPK